MSKSFFKTCIHDLGDPDTTVASDGLSSSEFTGYIDTGSYILNAAVSGSLYGGIPNNKAVVFAGDAATGKTFFVLGLCKHFLDKNPEGGVIFFESESAITKEIIEDRDIDSSRMVIMPVTTVQEFRHQAIQVLEK